MKPFLLKARAKVNLSLDVVGIRDDGYHKMKMINHSIDLHDCLRFETSETGVVLTSNARSLPLDERNLIVKVAQKMRRQFKITQGVKIHLKKKIPRRAGLAGGSSDAAATIKGLNALWKLNLSMAELLDLGVAIGADVPYCLVGGTALVEGIGEKITPLKPLEEKVVLVVKPHIDVATPWAFRKLDELGKFTHPDITKIIHLLDLNKWDDLQPVIGNVFEAVVFNIYSEIEEIKKQMLKQGATCAIMTGSGSTVVGYFKDVTEAERVRKVFFKKYALCFLSRIAESEENVDVG